jgi:fatty acid CoA ligase FadD9
VLPLLHAYRRPELPLQVSLAPAEVFRGAVQPARIGVDEDIPHLWQDVIGKASRTCGCSTC